MSPWAVPLCTVMFAPKPSAFATAAWLAFDTLPADVVTAFFAAACPNLTFTTMAVRCPTKHLEPFFRAAVSSTGGLNGLRMLDQAILPPFIQVMPDLSDLRWLRVGPCSFPAEFGCATTALTALRSLDIIDAGYGAPRALAPLAAALGHMPQLHTLRLRVAAAATGVNRSGQFLHAMPQLPALTCLSLREHTWSSQTVESLDRCFARCPALLRIALRATHWGIDPCMLYLSQCKHLTSLDLSNTLPVRSAAEWSSLFGELCRLPNLLRLRCCVGRIPRRPRPQSSDSGMPSPEPATALSSMSQLTALCFGGDATLLSCLGAALPDLRALVRLRLRSMDIGTGPSATTTESSCEVERNLSVLTRLQLLEVSRSAPSFVAQLLCLHPPLPSLRSLLLYGNALGDGGLVLACWLPALPLLRLLDVTGNHMGADVVASLQIVATQQGVLAFGVRNDEQAVPEAPGAS